MWAASTARKNSGEHGPSSMWAAPVAAASAAAVGAGGLGAGGWVGWCTRLSRAVWVLAFISWSTRGRGLSRRTPACGLAVRMAWSEWLCDQVPLGACSATAAGARARSRECSGGLTSGAGAVCMLGRWRRAVLAGVLQESAEQPRELRKPRDIQAEGAPRDVELLLSRATSTHDAQRTQHLDAADHHRAHLHLTTFLYIYRKNSKHHQKLKERC